jgi:hypothetical protein
LAKKLEMFRELNFRGLVLFFIIVTYSCDNTKVADYHLKPSDDGSTIQLIGKSTSQIILNVEDIKSFNYCHIYTLDGFYESHVKLNTNVLIIKDNRFNKIDSNKSALGPFENGYNMIVFLGNKKNNRSDDLSMSVSFGFKLIVVEQLDE